MNLVYLGLIVCFFLNLGVLYTCLHIWYGQKRSQQIKYWYDDEGKLQFDLDDRR